MYRTLYRRISGSKEYLERRRQVDLVIAEHNKHASTLALHLAIEYWIENRVIALDILHEEWIAEAQRRLEILAERLIEEGRFRDLFVSVLSHEEFGRLTGRIDDERVAIEAAKTLLQTTQHQRERYRLSIIAFSSHKSSCGK